LRRARRNPRLKSNDHFHKLHGNFAVGPVDEAIGLGDVSGMQDFFHFQSEQQRDDLAIVLSPNTLSVI